ncbi:DUF3859 domain-containing protein [Planctomycetota bacterium]
MAKPKISCKMVSYGIYDGWDRESKSLPQILDFRREVPARIGVEFGYILNFKKAKGMLLSFCIEHPPFLNKRGEVAPPFTGEEYVRSNDWNFYLGDTVWEPVEDKQGSWRLITELEGQVVADETFVLVEDTGTCFNLEAS